MTRGAPPSRTPKSDFPIPREKMVQALAAAGVRDRRVLDAMRRVPRHHFLPEPLWPKAYHDLTLPIGNRQTMTQPATTAMMLEALALSGRERVLEIGTGTGYQTALLSLLCSAVFSVERVASLARAAQANLRALDLRNISVKHFDGTYGWVEYAPYDAIIVSAAAPSIPAPLIEQLAVGGRIVIPIESNAKQEIRIVRKTAAGLEAASLGPCTFVPLVGRYGFPESKG